VVKSSGLVSLHAARTPAEEAMTEFVALRQRLQYAANEEDVRLLISAVQQKERIKYGSLREVAALDADASLLEIVSAVRKAAAPKRGRPPKLTASAGGFDVAMNWVDGGYSVESMAARAAFDTRRINVSQKETQSDVLVGSALLFTGRTRRCARSSSTRLPSRERRGGRWTAGTEGSVRGGLSGCSGGREASHGGHTIHACAQYSCSLTSV